MNIQHDMSEIIGVEQSSSSVVISINKKLDTTSSSPPKHIIFRVHTLLRTRNEMAYEPNIVAIGPYHRCKDRLRVMEDWKLCWFKSFLEERGESDATEYVEAMKWLEPEARQCYSESTENISKDEFVEMMLLDACFIIQLMRRYFYHHDLPAWCQSWTLNSLKRDLLLFENQIPLFVVQKLYSMIKLPEEPTHFHELTFQFVLVCLNHVSPIPYDKMGKIKRILDGIRENNIQHILELVHYTLCSVAVHDDNSSGPSVNVNEKSKAKWNLQLCEIGFKFIYNQLHRCMCRLGWFDQQDGNNICDGLESIPNVTKLHAAGVKFRSKKVEGNPFEINFENGVMEIPTFMIYDRTESLYRNLIAYEQYSQETINNYVCLHALAMDYLIDSAEDVALLRSFGIIYNAIGDDESVSSMFNNLVNQICMDSSKAQAKLFEEVNAYYGKRRHRWMAKLRRDYFNNPWAWISFLAALFLLLLTLTQTVFSILGGT